MDRDSNVNVKSPIFFPNPYLELFRLLYDLEIDIDVDIGVDIDIDIDVDVDVDINNL